MGFEGSFFGVKWRMGIIDKFYMFLLALSIYLEPFSGRPKDLLAPRTFGDRKCTIMHLATKF